MNIKREYPYPTDDIKPLLTRLFEACPDVVKVSLIQGPELDTPWVEAEGAEMAAAFNQLPVINRAFFHFAQTALRFEADADDQVLTVHIARGRQPDETSEHAFKALDSLLQAAHAA